MDCSSPWTAPRDAGTALFLAALARAWLEKLCQLQGWPRLAVLCVPRGTAVLDVFCILIAAASLGVPQALGIRERFKGQNQP